MNKNKKSISYVQTLCTKSKGGSFTVNIYENLYRFRNSEIKEKQNLFRFDSIVTDLSYMAKINTRTNCL